jgi:TolB-like protein/DNA-binding winged helix-turn-helix (wHTH) protein/Flp pilus assembly protein TadD
MKVPATASPRLRVGDFEVDLRCAEVRRSGDKIKLQERPFQILAALIERPGEVVTREEIRQKLWPTDTFVDFEHGINTAVKKLRKALGDDAENPRFIATLPRHGYRFIAPVEVVETNGTCPKPETPSTPPKRKQRTGLWVGLAALVVAGVALTCMFAFDWGDVRSRLVAGVGARHIGSLAVLPLRNLSNDPQQEYFSDGMTDELITALAKLKSLKVISHTSVDRYKQGNRTLPEIARELGVDAVVEGTVTRSGDHVRITAQLVDARSDQHLWAESYERDLKDVLSLQDQVAGQIAAQVGIKVAAGQQTRMASTRQVVPEAHEAYLKGNFYWSRSNCDGSQKGLSYYQQAVAKDPTFAAAYVGLAQAYFTLGDWNCSPYEEAFSKSKAAAQSALELDPTAGSAHTWLGTIAFFYEWNWDNAEREYREAVQLSPNYAPAHILYSVFLVSMARQEEGLAEMRKALELDPTAEFTNMVSVHILYLARQYDEAIEQANNASQLYPDSWGTYFWLGVAYERKGMYEQAVEAYLKSNSVQGAKPEELEAFRNAYQKSGIRGYWQHVRDTVSGDGSETCSMSSIYARLGETEQTIDYLNQDFQKHCPSIRTLKVDSFYDNLRGDPRFQDLLARLQLQ